MCPPYHRQYQLSCWDSYLVIMLVALGGRPLLGYGRYCCQGLVQGQGCWGELGLGLCSRRYSSCVAGSGAAHQPTSYLVHPWYGSYCYYSFLTTCLRLRLPWGNAFDTPATVHLLVTVYSRSHITTQYEYTYFNICSPM